MTGTELHERGKRIFLEACERPEPERAAYLEQECANDAELRREVESLLAHREALADEPGVDDGRPDAFDPDLVAGFRLLQRLGEGGMGEVFEAEQLAPMRRRVAIKLLKRGLETKEVVTRFESERQALALMSHRNVARVFEAGSTVDGRPYFAMEFVGGVSIVDYCDSARLGVRERLELFVQVCQGVQHAHQRGVIHRDLKGSNVLVTVRDDGPVPKVIDFGIAKATGTPLTEKTLVTRGDRWMGTPESMSPEQAEGRLDIDTRTDVYSLGVMLYELLVGELPFSSGELRDVSAEEMHRRIRHEVPTRPSVKVRKRGVDDKGSASSRRSDPEALGRKLRGDLDWIVMKALEKDRVQRYESPSALAADIERHLANQPILAGRPSIAYRVRKFTRRHRLGVAAALLVAASILLGALGTIAGLVRARREAESAQRVAQTLVGVFEGLNPENAEGYLNAPQQILERGAAEIEAELAGEPELQARLLATLGRIYTVLGEYQRAEPLLAQAIAIQRELRSANPTELARSLSFSGFLELATGSYEAARSRFEEGLAIRRSTHGPSSLEAAQGLVDLGIAELRRGDYGQAMERFDEALEIRIAALGPEHAEVMNVRFFRAEMLTFSGQFESARSEYRAVLESRLERSPGHPSTAWCLASLGRFEIATDADQATEYLVRATEILEAAYGADHPAVAVPLHHLSRVLLVKGEGEEAKRVAERAHDIRARRLGASHPAVAWTHSRLGDVELWAGHYEEASRHFRQQLEISQARLASDHPDVGWALVRNAVALVELRRFDEARPLLERAETLFESRGSYGQLGAAWATNRLGYLLWQQGSPELGVPLLERTAASLERQLGADHAELVIPLMALGAALRDGGDLERARPYIERGYELRLRTVGERTQGHADDLHTMARLNHREGNVEEAARFYERAIEATERVLGPEHPWTVRALRDYAELLRSIGKIEQARRLEAIAAGHAPG